ncbi:MAG: MotA/TolQ/ExbB proton channel family protein [Lentisphaerae bacterium]|jgi:biopolymer transport protein ExbB|nr:MotA/TolQ/ExbB proton channel family protein [Lentisphaerota bacterium]
MTRKMTRLALGLSLLIVPVAAFAAEGETAEKNLFDMIMEGGWAMIPLGLMSLAMVYFIVQNGLAVREKVLLRPDLFPEFIKLMQQKKISEAHALCQQNKTLFTYILGAGLERCSDHREVNFEKVKEAIEEASTEEVTTYMKPIDYLSIIGATAPMLGLLGTVSGMIGAFNFLGISGSGKSSELASYIGEALMTTAAGLVIAIPSMLFFYYYRNSFIKSTASVGRNIGALLDTLETGEAPMGFRD